MPFRDAVWTVSRAGQPTKASSTGMSANPANLSGKKAKRYSTMSITTSIKTIGVDGRCGASHRALSQETVQGATRIGQTMIPTVMFGTFGSIIVTARWGTGRSKLCKGAGERSVLTHYGTVGTL